MKPRRSRASGFTLIEVVVAFVLLSIVLAIAFEIFSNGLRRAGDLDDYSSALVVAQTRLALAGAEEALKEGQTQGETEDRRFHWVVSITNSEFSAVEPGKVAPGGYALYRVEVKVAWRGADAREHSMSLATLGLGQRA
ncbi:MAG: type II secretion system protein [Usitatibacter sp.]